MPSAAACMLVLGLSFETRTKKNSACAIAPPRCIDVIVQAGHMRCFTMSAEEIKLRRTCRLELGQHDARCAVFMRWIKHFFKAFLALFYDFMRKSALIGKFQFRSNVVKVLRAEKKGDALCFKAATPRPQTCMLKIF